MFGWCLVAIWLSFVGYVAHVCCCVADAWLMFTTVWQMFGRCPADVCLCLVVFANVCWWMLMFAAVWLMFY